MNILNKDNKNITVFSTFEFYGCKIQKFTIHIKISLRNYCFHYYLIKSYVTLRSRLSQKKKLTKIRFFKQENDRKLLISFSPF